MLIIRDEPGADLALLQPVDDRVEQARKVQQVNQSTHLRTSLQLNSISFKLLAALKQPQNGAPPATPPSSGPPPLPGGYPGLPSVPQPPANSNGFYPPPPSNVQRPPFPGSLPPPPANANPYSSMSPSTPQPGQGQPSMGNLPPNLLALLQQSQAHPQAAPGMYNNMPPQQTINPSSASNVPPNPQPGYNQLMAYLVSVKFVLLCDCHLRPSSQQSQAAASGPK